MNTSLVPGSAPRIYYGYWLIAGAFVAQFVAYGIFQLWRLWQLGGREARFDRWPERLKGLLIEIFVQRRQLRVNLKVYTAHNDKPIGSGCNRIVDISVALSAS